VLAGHLTGSDRRPLCREAGHARGYAATTTDVPLALAAALTLMLAPAFVLALTPGHAPAFVLA
jgi:hypothetical protein